MVVPDVSFLESSLGMLSLGVRDGCLSNVLQHRRHHRQSPDERLNSCCNHQPGSTKTIPKLFLHLLAMRMVSHHMHYVKCVKTKRSRNKPVTTAFQFTFIEFVFKLFFSIPTRLDIVKHINGGIYHARNIFHHFAT